MSAPFLARLDPPEGGIKKWSSQHRTTDQPHADQLPQVFLDALSVREEVFVNEQNCGWENEVDDDDPRSFHFVVYASVSSSNSTSNNNSTSPADARKPSGHSLPVGTIRLVPSPHPPHPLPAAPVKAEGADPLSVTPKYHEPYLKLTRLAVLQPYRHLKLGRLLVNTALSFASKHPNEARGRLGPAAVEALKIQNGDDIPTSDLPVEIAAAISPIAEKADAFGSITDGQEVARVVEQATGEWKGLILVHAQKVAQSFWERSGFEVDEGLGEWDEEGILHVGMWKRVDVRRRSG